MNILLCVKQVPDTTEIKIDPVTNTLIRAGVPSIVNTFDNFALELALRLRESEGGTVTAISMGPPQAVEALKTCLAIGADKAILLSDRAFGGSDTLATSYILSCAIAKLEEENGRYDLIFCGKQAIDGDTAQVGPEIAEHMGRTQITYAVDTYIKEGSLHVKRECDVGYDILSCAYPAIITVTKTAFETRSPTIRSKLAANRAEIPTMTTADFEIDTTRCGLKGSPTRVRKAYTPTHNKNTVIIEEASASQSVEKLLTHLQEAKLLT